MASVYTKIINREIPGYILYEDDDHIAILDINPLTDGHTLVIPKEESITFDEMEPDKFLALMKVAQRIAQHHKRVLNKHRIIMISYGFGVDHTHIHLVPVDKYEEYKRAVELHESGTIEPDHEKLAEMHKILKLSD